MMQIELDSWTARQQRTRVPTSDNERRRQRGINRECKRNHGGYSMKGAAVLLSLVIHVHVITCTCIYICVMYLCRCESDVCMCINLYVICVFVYVSYGGMQSDKTSSHEDSKRNV